MSNVLQLVVPSSQTNLILQNLDPDTDYYVNVAALYDGGLGGELERDGRTCMPNFAFQTKIFAHLITIYIPWHQCHIFQLSKRALNYRQHWNLKHLKEHSPVLTVLTCFLQWECSVLGTCVFLMSGTPVSRWPGTLPPPELRDTSSSTSLRV